MTTGKEKAIKIKAEIEKKKASLATLQSLNGKMLKDLTKSQRDSYDVAIGQLLNVLDAEGKIKI